jgi:exopolysaccharide biosynthesis polyprenyl glycosylphosphotransferase
MIDWTRAPKVPRAYALCRRLDFVVFAAAAGASVLDPEGNNALVAPVLWAEATVLWLFASRLVHQYEPGNGRGPAGDMALTLALLAGIALPMLATSAIVSPLVPMRASLRFLAVVVPSVALLRLTVVCATLWRSRPMAELLVVGASSLGRVTGVELVSSDEHRRLVGYLRFPQEAPTRNLPARVLGEVDELEAVLRAHPVDEVYFASIASEHHRDIQKAITTCERLGVPFAIPSCAFRLIRARALFAGAVADGYAHFTSVHVTSAEQAMKRCLDIAVSACALVILSPVFVVAALAVKLTSPGPILFRQERVGLMGRRFQMLKFRSMVANADALKAQLLQRNEQSGPVFKMREDPRVTPLGRFLRKYSIDELPQLVNVFRGDMSLVGPRPPLPSEVARYQAWQLRRLSVRPGLTCVWQVSGRSEVSFQDWMLLDMRYIDHWSFVGDLSLIVRTIPVVLTGRGAH